MLLVAKVFSGEKKTIYYVYLKIDGKLTKFDSVRVCFVLSHFGEEYAKGD